MNLLELLKKLLGIAKIEQPIPVLPPEGPDTTPNFGKGCIPTPEIVKENQYVLAATPQPVIDWSVPFRIPATLVQKNQNGSSSCTAQATDYYVQALNQIEHGTSELYSSRWIYSQSYIPPDGGAYIWKAMSIPIKLGVADLNSVPEGNSSENIMRDASDNYKAILEAKTDKYAVISRQGQSIDFMAQVIKDYHGYVTGFNGYNDMFAPDGTVKDWSKVDWGHAVYICGYELRNGVKCLVFKNSWGSSWGDGGYGYFPESFVNSGRMFDAYVYALIEDLDPKSIMLTAKHVRELQALEGYRDESGVAYWSGLSDGKPKVLADYLAARLLDKIKTINESLVQE